MAGTGECADFRGQHSATGGFANAEVEEEVPTMLTEQLISIEHVTPKAPPQIPRSQLQATDAPEAGYPHRVEDVF